MCCKLATEACLASDVKFLPWLNLFAGIHFEQVSGTLKFSPGETQKDIKIAVLKGMVESQFQVILSDPTNTALNARKATCDVYFTQDEKFGLMMRMVKSIMHKQDRVFSSSNSWFSQFKEAIVPGGDVNLDGAPAEQLQFTDYILHYIAFSWKVKYTHIHSYACK